jgi:hypothetical protein
LGQELNIITTNPYPWQAEVLNMIKQEPHPRNIYWIFDPIGNKGKSALVKKLCKDGIGHLLSWDEQRDVFHARSVHQHLKVVLFDLTR